MFDKFVCSYRSQFRRTAVESSPLYLFKQKVNKPSCLQPVGMSSSTRPSDFNPPGRTVGYLTPKFPVVEHAIPLSVIFVPRVFRNHNQVTSERKVYSIRYRRGLLLSHRRLVN